MSKASICLWFDGQAEDAANFYTATFPDTRVGAVLRAPGDYRDGKEGQVLTVEFTLLGTSALGLNGGPHFKFNEAISIHVHTDDQAETDRLWTAITSGGGAESRCGWCKDRFGLSWQVTPRRLTELMADPDKTRSKRVFTAMMGIKKIDIAALETAATDSVVAHA